MSDATTRPDWHASMSPLEYKRVMEMRRQMLAQKAPHVYRVTPGEPVIGDTQVTVGEPVVDPPSREALLLEMLRRRASQQPTQGVLASLYAGGQ